MRITALTALSLLLAACDTSQPSDIGEAALAGGDWGWDEGAGCASASAMIRFEGDRMTFFEAGEAVHSSPVYERELVYSDRMAGSRGRLEATFWTYYRRDDNGENIFVRDRFSVRYTGGTFNGLTFATREERPADGGQFRRVRGDHLPSGTLTPCAAA